MFIRLLYKDANFHIYKIDENGSIKKNDDEVLSPDDIIYHSTNGYDYVLLEKFDGTLTMYPLDKVVYNSFYPESLSVWNHFKCIHLNGDLRDNRLENLEGVKEEEEWRMITYPGVEPGRFMVSSFGNLWDDKLKRIKSMRDKAGGINNGKKYYVTDILQHVYQVHRLVAYEFIEKYDVTSNIVINHIDNNGLNNQIDNLEIVTHKQNCDHAIIIGAENGMIRSEELIETFCKLYVKNKGDVKKTKDDLRKLGIGEAFKHRFVSEIIRKNRWSDITDKYFKLGDYELPYKEQLTDEEIHAVCKAIVECGGSPTAVLNELHNNGHNRIQMNDVKKIRYKFQFTDISDNYFTKNQFKVNHKAFLTEDEVIDICLKLIEYDFSTLEVVKYYKDCKNDHIYRRDIHDIKHKFTHSKISDRYFLKLGKGDFKVLRYNK